MTSLVRRGEERSEEKKMVKTSAKAVQNSQAFPESLQRA
jgi:hypothetical protein